MKFDILKPFVFSVFCAAVMIAALCGCDSEQAADAVKSAGDKAEEIEKEIADDAAAAMDKSKEMASELGEKGKELADKGKELASELGEKASSFMAPLKEKFGSLDKLKETPAELKKTVADLIQMIEGKAEDLKLPESMGSALATIKEKLVALKDYLEGEYEQAKIDEKVKGILDSVKSGLGM